MMPIGSLLIEALRVIQGMPLNHYQGNLIPAEECIPGFNSLTECPDTLYPVGKQPFPLMWDTLSESFSFKVQGKELDQEAFTTCIHSAIEMLQKQINEAVEMASGSVCLLSWLGKLYREGFGDYNTEHGGYGCIVDPRTLTRFGIYGCTIDGYFMMDIYLTFSIVNI